MSHLNAICEAITWGPTGGVEFTEVLRSPGRGTNASAISIEMCYVNITAKAADRNAEALTFDSMGKVHTLWIIIHASLSPFVRILCMSN